MYNVCWGADSYAFAVLIFFPEYTFLCFNYYNQYYINVLNVKNILSVLYDPINSMSSILETCLKFEW